MASHTFGMQLQIESTANKPQFFRTRFSTTLSRPCWCGLGNDTAPPTTCHRLCCVRLQSRVCANAVVALRWNLLLLKKKRHNPRNRRQKKAARMYPNVLQ